ncbi:hypothetical protein B0H19DRAFT_1126288 [Mycena capillaripes]|nr:hypothetical protein B0H19DRAFT_1126288 [Mycena capillaripes]
MQFEVKVTAFGFEGRHVKIKMKSVMPSSDSSNGPGLQTWMTEFVRTLAMDVKHSGKWLCSQCGKPARELQLEVLSWLHLSEPLLVFYVHQLCENKDGPCDRAAKADSNVWRRDSGFPPNPPNSTRNINPIIQPLSRSCARCHRDPFEAPEAKLKRCGRCKVIRYCSVECQTADYKRHKNICKSIVDVEYGKWAADDRD